MRLDRPADTAATWETDSLWFMFLHRDTTGPLYWVTLYWSVVGGHTNLYPAGHDEIVHDVEAIFHAVPDSY